MNRRYRNLRIPHPPGYRALCFLLALAICVPITTQANTKKQQLSILDQHAPESEIVKLWAEGAEALQNFATVPEYIGRTPDKQDGELHAALEVECDLKPFSACQTYIKAHRQEILTSLPDNPDYWSAFRDVLAAPAHIDLNNLSMDGAKAHQRMIHASTWWFYRTLAQDGQVSYDEVLKLQNAIRAWRTTHQTMIGRMIAAAMQGLSLDQISFTMAQASRSRDQQMLNQLAELVRPVTRDEMSWGPVLWFEREFILRTLAENPPDERQIREDLAATHPYLEEQQVQQIVLNPAAFVTADLEAAARYILPVSTMSWADYWAGGIPPFTPDTVNPGTYATLVAPAYASYINTERVYHFYPFIFAGLMDIYAGRTSPGIPARPAPARWRWDWIDGDQPELCLVADGIHPTTRQASITDPESWCIEYYDDEAVERLFR